MNCTRGQDHVAVTFKNGRSAKIQQFGPSDRAEREQFYQRIVFRFGLEIWQQPGSPAVIAIRPGALILSDTEAAK